MGEGAGPAGPIRVRLVVLMAVLIVVGGLASACGSNSASPHISPSPTTTQAQHAFETATKLAACMRSHDVPGFPEPVVIDNGAHVLVPVHVLGDELSSPQVRAADSACKQYTPGGKGFPLPTSTTVASPKTPA